MSLGKATETELNSKKLSRLMFECYKIGFPLVESGYEGLTILQTIPIFKFEGLIE